MKRFPRWGWYAVIAAAVIIPALGYILAELNIAGTMGFPLDDSWIHLVYARNIAAGDFFAYNPHQPVAGSTAPLWTVILGLGYLISHSVFLMPKVLGVLLNIGTGIVVFRLSEYLGLKEFASCVLAVLVVTATRIVWASVSGMEVSLYLFLFLASVYYYIRYINAVTWKSYLAPVFAAAAVAARPEFFLLPVFFVLHQLALRRKVKNAKQKDSATAKTFLTASGMIKRGVVFVFCTAPFFGLNLALSGNFFPLTFSAKTAGRGLSGLLDQADFGEIFRRSFLGLWLANNDAFAWIWGADNIFLAVVAVIVFFTVVFHWWRKGIRSPLESALFLLAIIFFLFAPVRSVVTGMLDFGQFGRYAAFLTPVMILLAAYGIYYWLRQREIVNPRMALILFGAANVLCLFIFYNTPGYFGKGHQWPSMDWYEPFLDQRTWGDIGLFICLIVAVTVLTDFSLRKKYSFDKLFAFILLQCLCFAVIENIQTAPEYGWNVRNINQTQVAIGEWLAKNTPSGTVYATNDIGAMPFYATQDTLVDLMGLVSPEVVSIRETGTPQDIISLWVMEKRHPEYFVCFNEWFPRLTNDGVSSGLLTPVHAVEIDHNLTCGGPNVRAMYVYKVDYTKLADFISQRHIQIPQ
ncbi:MAG TPA: hypothetical protein VFJ29_05705 [Candidatus Kapabacteria bacterium]|nr:hypothetical protein [Candidatus Kapabacteria bacterium]